jgi:capsular exopolysaccharide synthesis family protein
MNLPDIDEQAFSFIQYTNTKTVKSSPNLLRQRRGIMGLKNEPQADIFRQLRTRVLRKLRENKWNSLGITGATAGVGKSFVTANLAIALSMEVNQTVLVVDADLRNPNLGWFFGLDVEKGLLDYLNGGVSLEHILINPGFQRLVILPGRGSTTHSSELLSSPKMVSLVNELKSRYDSRIILFDLPPLLASDDTLLFMPHFDATLLVVEDGKNTADEIRRSLQILEETELLGTVLNKARETMGEAYYPIYAPRVADTADV